MNLRNLLKGNKGIINVPVDNSLTVREQALEFFESVYGQDDLKENIYRVLTAEDNNINLMLVGPPATSKTLVMNVILEKCKDVVFFGANTTAAGLIETLYKHQNAKIVIIDELDKLKKTDLDCILGLLNDGKINKNLKTVTYDFKMNCKVFATSNSSTKFKAAIKSRFQIYTLKPYTDEEFIEVVKFCIGAKLGEDKAEAVAQILIENDRKDARIAISLVGTMRPSDSIEDIIKVVETYLKYQAEGEVDYN